MNFWSAAKSGAILSGLILVLRSRIVSPDLLLWILLLIDRRVWLVESAYWTWLGASAVSRS